MDILVASHLRRVSNQDADIRRHGGARPRNVYRQDPEIESLEAAQVLEGVRGHSPPFDGDNEADIEPMGVPHRSKMITHGTTPRLDGIYEHTIPECEGQVEEPEEEVVFQPQQHQNAQQWMGYFDPHPDRQPLT